MLVHEVMSTGLVTAKKTDTVRSAVMKMMTRHSSTVPVVEGDNQLVGMVTLRDVSLDNRNGLRVAGHHFHHDRPNRICLLGRHETG